MYYFVFDRNLFFLYWLIVVYGSNDIDYRRGLWNEFESIDFSFVRVWCIVGDFNVVMCVDDRINSILVFDIEIRDLIVFMNNCCFFIMRVCNRYYIWFNGRVFRKIDRVMCNFDW